MCLPGVGWFCVCIGIERYVHQNRQRRSGQTLTGQTLTGQTLTGQTLTGQTLTGQTHRSAPTIKTLTKRMVDGRGFEPPAFALRTRRSPS